MSTREDEVAQKSRDDQAARAQKWRDEEAARLQKIRDDALTADLSHAKDKAEEERIKRRYDDETAAAQRDKAERDRVERDKARDLRGN